MLLTAVLIATCVSLISTAPTGGCGDAIECMYAKLQKERKGDTPTVNVKPVPCKRMLSRHGKRSAEEVDCDNDDEEPTTPETNKRIFLEKQIDNMVRSRELVEPLKDENLRDITSSDTKYAPKSRELDDNSQSDDGAEEKQPSMKNLNSQIDVLKSKIAEIKDHKGPEIMPAGRVDSDKATDKAPPASDETQASQSTDNLRNKLQDIEDDIERIKPMLTSKKPHTNLQQLKALSARLAAEDKRRKESTKDSRSSRPQNYSPKATITTTNIPASLSSASESPESLESKLNELTDLVNNLIEINKLSYLDLKRQIEELKQVSR